VTHASPPLRMPGSNPSNGFQITLILWLHQFSPWINPKKKSWIQWRKNLPPNSISSNPRCRSRKLTENGTQVQRQLASRRPGLVEQWACGGWHNDLRCGCVKMKRREERDCEDEEKGREWRWVVSVKKRSDWDWGFF